MANLQAKNEENLQKTMFDYQNSFNSWSNNRSQMVEAGFNPALMFGGSSSPVTFESSGSASGSASNLPQMSPLFKSIDPFEFGNQQIAKQNADSLSMNAGTNSAVGTADVALKKQQTLESASRTAENVRNTALQHRMENVIYDTAMANLMETSARAADFKSRTRERDTMLQPRIENLEANTRRIVTEIEREPLVRAQMSADIRRLRSVVRLNDEMSTTEGVKRKKMASEIDAIGEGLKSSRLERIMSEFGLKQRHKGSDKGYVSLSDFDSRDREAYMALISAGFSPTESAAAVLWYTGVDPKDLTPSIINGASRVLSGTISAATSVATRGAGPASAVRGLFR